jgi:hypothetical protein
MHTHDIIDNWNEKLAENIKSILSSTVTAGFAVGSFFLSGLTGHLIKFRRSILDVVQ